jgi:ribonuclease III
MARRLRRGERALGQLAYNRAVESIGYEFRRPELLAQALTHASVASERDNERLEFLGDAALNLATTELLFAREPALSEGAMTEIKAAVVSRRALAESARALGLDAAALLGKGLQGRALPVSVLANLYEAVLGAIYVDGGFEPARAFVRRTLSATLADAERELASANPKQRLQHLAQARWATLPDYELLETRGDAHARAFLVRAKLGEREQGLVGRPALGFLARAAPRGGERALADGSGDATGREA